jgi:hypothetical protein
MATNGFFTSDSETTTLIRKWFKIPVGIGHGNGKVDRELQ